ncbi:MAG: hypothetical protein U5P41_04860 [Gammaproteobacteria bacterium]|nr:hypothetical protein [Gammaproteobacteria bacterium]
MHDVRAWSGYSTTRSRWRENLATAASTDPISAVLVVLGALVIGAASVAFGGVALGGVLDTFVPDSATKRKRRPRT